MGVAIRFGGTVLSVQVWYWDAETSRPYLALISWQRLNKLSKIWRFGEIHDNMGRKKIWKATGDTYK